AHMTFTIRGYAPDDAGALQALLDAPGVVEQYDLYAGLGGVARLLADPFTPAAGGGGPRGGPGAGGFPASRPRSAPPRPRAAPRRAVRPRARRQGLPRAFHAATVEGTQAQGPRRELALSAWQPEPGAEAFAAALGYRHERWMWLMTRARGTPPAPEWPAGIRVRALDGGDAMVADWNRAYNHSFAEHYRYVPSSLAHTRAVTHKPGFRPDAVLLAYLGGEVVGFCRCELFDRRGEIGTIGTVPAARGIGLGRALLRWGVAWLERESVLPVTLLVDGENERARRLYQSEGFEVTRTRRMWARPAESE